VIEKQYVVLCVFASSQKLSRYHTTLWLFNSTLTIDDSSHYNDRHSAWDEDHAGFVVEVSMRRPLSVFTVSAILAVSVDAPARAQDAEFGCKVLLCAAASNPSWPSIPYCVPVMNQLFSMMRSVRFRWPVCTAAGTGAPGYEPYQPCPTGWQETRQDAQTSGQAGGGDGVSSSLQHGGNDLCARRLPSQPSGRPLQASVPGGQIQCPASDGDNGGVINSGQMCIEYMPRPLSERPYHFDVRNTEGNLTRVWFNVR